MSVARWNRTIARRGAGPAAQDHRAVRRAYPDTSQRGAAVPCDGFEAAAGSWPDGEEQLVVVASGDGGGRRVRVLFLEPGACRSLDRQGVGVDDRSDTAS